MALTLDDMGFTVRHAHSPDGKDIIELSQRVQDKLTQTGSLQHIGPLEQEALANAIVDQHCFLLENKDKKIVGCALVRRLESNYFVTTSNFNMESRARPYLYLHSIMLEPEQQGRGNGIAFVTELVRMIAGEQPNGGTLFLDCWAGNDKLRKFYSGVGFEFAAVVPEEDYEIAVFYRLLDTSRTGRAV